MWPLLFIGMAYAMPEVQLEKKWIACKTNDECIVAGDACRSCGKLQIINRNFHNEFIEQDNGLRAKLGIVRSCEACDTSKVKLACVNSICTKKN